jgi:hypothetical protein
MRVPVTPTGGLEGSVTLLIVAGVVVALLVCACAVVLRRRVKSRG